MSTPAHHRVQAVHRFVQDQHLRVAAQGQPEGGLLLHPLGQPADGLLLIHLGEGLGQSLVPLHIESRVDPPVEAHHVLGGGGAEIVQVVGDSGDLGLHRRVLIDLFPVHQHGARVRAVDAHDVPQDRGLACAVGTHQTVDRALLRRHCQAVQGSEAVEGLDHIVHLDHSDLPPSKARILAHSSSPLAPRNSSSPAVWSKVWSSSFFRPSSTPVLGAAKEPLPGTEQT